MNNPVFVANDQLKPEISKTTELVWAYVENDHYVQTSFFYTELIDLIQSTNTSPQTLLNSGVEKSSGIESEWVATIDSSWNLRSSATYFFDRPEGKQSSESEFLFSSAVTYTSSPYLVSFLMNHQSSKVDQNSSLKGATTHGSFTTFDVFAKYFVKDDLEVFAKVKNVFDKDYLTPGFISSNTYGIQGFSRQLEVGINLSFGG